MAPSGSGNRNVPSSTSSEPIRQDLLLLRRPSLVEHDEHLTPGLRKRSAAAAVVVHLDDVLADRGVFRGEALGPVARRHVVVERLAAVALAVAVEDLLARG